MSVWHFYFWIFNVFFFVFIFGAALRLSVDFQRWNLRTILATSRVLFTQCKTTENKINLTHLYSMYKCINDECNKKILTRVALNVHNSLWINCKIYEGQRDTVTETERERELNKQEIGRARVFVNFALHVQTWIVFDCSNQKKKQIWKWNTEWHKYTKYMNMISPKPVNDRLSELCEWIVVVVVFLMTFCLFVCVCFFFGLKMSQWSEFY